jgi:hypothetical protein
MGTATRSEVGSGQAIRDQVAVTARAESLEARNATVRIAVAVACLLGAQFLHWSVIDQHAQEWSAAGTFFFLLALAEGLMTVLVIARLRPWVAGAAIVISAVPVLVWAWDRTLGLPFGPTNGVRGTIGRSDVLSVVFETLTIIALWPFLRPGYGRGRPVRLDLVGRVVVGATFVYVIGFSYWAMLGDQGSIHAAGTTAAAAAQTAPTSSAIETLESVAPGLAAVQTLSYVGKEFSFAGPTTAPAGVTRIELQNQGLEPHDLQVARIPESSPTPSNLANLQTMFADAQAGTASAPTIIADTGSTDRGLTSTTTVNLTPGRYILSCANTTPEGSFHYDQGMIMVLEISG